MTRLLSAVLLMLLALAAKGEPLWIKLDTITSGQGTPEGVWRLPSGTIFEIKARGGQPGIYDLTLLHSNDLSVEAGTGFGTMTAGADRRTFDASLLSDPKARGSAGKGRRRDFVITFNDDFTHLSLRHYRKGYRSTLCGWCRIFSCRYRAQR